MVKPLSAMTLSPGSSASRRPLCSVICLSDVLPGQASETKVITPDGLMPTKELQKAGLSEEELM